MDFIKAIIAAFVNFFAGLRNFIYGLKMDKIVGLSKAADKLEGIDLDNIQLPKFGE